MTDQTLQITIQSIQNATILTPVGDIDMGNSSQLRAALKNSINEEPSKIIIDFHAVPYMDSSGLGTLIEALQLSNQISTQLFLSNVTESVMSIIHLSKLDNIFTICDTKEIALAK